MLAKLKFQRLGLRLEFSFDLATHVNTTTKSQNKSYQKEQASRDREAFFHNSLLARSDQVAIRIRMSVRNVCFEVMS